MTYEIYNTQLSKYGNSSRIYCLATLLQFLIWLILVVRQLRNILKNVAPTLLPMVSFQHDCYIMGTKHTYVQYRQDLRSNNQPCITLCHCVTVIPDLCCAETGTQLSHSITNPPWRYVYLPPDCVCTECHFRTCWYTLIIMIFTDSVKTLLLVAKYVC